MATDRDFIEFIADQLAGAGEIAYRKMFGQYALYCDGKVVALVCNNQVFVKPTEKGRSFIGTPVEAPAYPGAKPSFLIEDRLDDRAWLTDLIRLTAHALPPPGPKRPKSKKKAKPIKNVKKSNRGK